MSKTYYTKEHELQSAKKGHRKNILKRDGRILHETKTMLEYDFPEKPKAKAKSKKRR
jgi:hypothetical protein